MSVIDILLPKMGESVAEATILKWLKQAGETVEKDETLVEIGTDKVESDLPSEFEGVITEILVQEGDTVEVGQVIARIEIEADKTELSVAAPSHVKQVSEIKPKPQQIIPSKTLKNASVFLSPVVQKIATEENIDLEELTTIKGTGANNRISKKDLLAYLESKKPKAKALGFSPQKRNLPITPEDDVQQLSRMRQLIANKMLESVNTIPHVTTFAEVDVTGLKAWREKNKQQLIEQQGVKITYTHIMMFKVVETLKEFPKLNAWLNGNDEFILKKHIALGFATALPDGNLIVPNIKHANQKDLIGLAQSVTDIAQKARTGKLPADAIQHTTFTVSNTGKFGSLMGTPIISIPQVAVLALGEIHRRTLVYKENGEEQFGPRDAMMLSISYDHRVIDGAYAASFLSSLKNKLQAYHS